MQQCSERQAVTHHKHIYLSRGVPTMTTTFRLRTVVEVEEEEDGRRVYIYERMFLWATPKIPPSHT